MGDEKYKSCLISILLTDVGLLQGDWRWLCLSTRVCGGKLKSRELGWLGAFWTRQPWKHKLPCAPWSMSDMQERVAFPFFFSEWKHSTGWQQRELLHFNISHERKIPKVLEQKRGEERKGTFCFCLVVFYLNFHLYFTKINTQHIWNFGRAEESFCRIFFHVNKRQMWKHGVVAVSNPVNMYNSYVFLLKEHYQTGT